MNILLMDDDLVILALLQGAMSKWGHHVVTFSNPDQCPAYCAQTCPCTLCKSGCPDCILVDVNMPNVNGVKFVEELLRKQCKSHKIGMMSGDWSPLDAQKAQLMGATVFSKPFELKKIRAWIAEDAA